jgi:uncharacterized protein YciI
MFIVLLKFSTEKQHAAEFMSGHKAWLDQGFADGVFIVAGSLQAAGGGLVLAHNASRAELQTRIEQDPFVIHHVVSAEVIEATPSRADERLRFLLA